MPAAVGFTGGFCQYQCQCNIAAEPSAVVLKRTIHFEIKVEPQLSDCPTYQALRIIQFVNPREQSFSSFSIQYWYTGLIYTSST